jgi:hypothetical protein
MGETDPDIGGSANVGSTTKASNGRNHFADNRWREWRAVGHSHIRPVRQHHPYEAECAVNFEGKATTAKKKIATTLNAYETRRDKARVGSFLLTNISS